MKSLISSFSPFRVAFFFFFFFGFVLFVWPCWVLAVALGSFDLHCGVSNLYLRHTGYSIFVRDYLVVAC